jgi:sortase A
VRAVLSWILLLGGVSSLLIGLVDFSTAWWDQPATIAAQPAPEEIPAGFIGKLTFPRLDASLFVVDAKRARDLRRGPGYVAGSVRPGDPGNCIIAGHRDLHFRLLKDVHVGDDILVETGRGRFTYRVSRIEVVEPTNNRELLAVYPQQLTLVTCFPFYYVGPAPRRYIVKAYRLAGS